MCDSNVLNNGKIKSEDLLDKFLDSDSSIENIKEEKTTDNNKEKEINTYHLWQPD